MTLKAIIIAHANVKKSELGYKFTHTEINSRYTLLGILHIYSGRYVIANPTSTIVIQIVILSNRFNHDTLLWEFITHLIISTF